MTDKIYLSTVASSIVDAKLRLLMDVLDIELEAEDLELRAAADRNDLDFEQTEVNQGAND